MLVRVRLVDHAPSVIDYDSDETLAANENCHFKGGRKGGGIPGKYLNTWEIPE